MHDFEAEFTDRNRERGTSESSALIEPRPMRGFVQTKQIKEVASRALNYLRSGFPVHFRGPTGAGKTTLALHVAHKLRRPMVLIHGDDQFTSADLTGKSQGYSKKKVIDEFVRGVSKTEESMQSNWVDHRLTVAVRDGHTLLYDEFNRSRPEANNILLSVLQEGVLDFPVSGGKGETYLQVHPNFKIIFTSNPEEYAGVNKTQDALLDRMVTIDLEHYNMDTEMKIATAKSRLSPSDAEKIVSIVRELRDKSSSGYLPTVRGCIMVAKSVKRCRGAEVSKHSDQFRQICHDVLISEIIRKEDNKNRESLRHLLDSLIDKYCVSAEPIVNHDNLADAQESQGTSKPQEANLPLESDLQISDTGFNLDGQSLFRVAIPEETSNKSAPEEDLDFPLKDDGVGIRMPFEQGMISVKNIFKPDYGEE
jgi:nitric oxide reductase NorQ protein